MGEMHGEMLLYAPGLLARATRQIMGRGEKGGIVKWKSPLTGSVPSLMHSGTWETAWIVKWVLLRVWLTFWFVARAYSPKSQKRTTLSGPGAV